MDGGFAAEKQNGITHMSRKTIEQENPENKNQSTLIDNIIKIKNIIKPVTLNTQNPNGLENFTICLNTVYDCIQQQNCKFTMLSNNQLNNEINVLINQIRSLKLTNDRIQYNYLLHNAFKINPYLYINNLISK